MKKVSFNTRPFIPASHENPNCPGALKKVLFTYKDIISRGKIQMINWSRLSKNKSFVSHYHQDMDEVFIIISGKVRIEVDREKSMLERGDAVLIPMGSIHKMENVGKEDVNYIVIGISLEKGGKTIIYEA